jgi:hypothetical protein
MTITPRSMLGISAMAESNLLNGVLTALTITIPFLLSISFYSPSWFLFQPCIQNPKNAMRDFVV